MRNDHKISFRDYYIKILSKVWVILTMGIIGTLGSYYVTMNFVEPTYEATVTLYNGNKTTGYSQLNKEEELINSELMDDYIELLKSGQVQEEIIQRSEYNLTDSSLEKNLDIVVMHGTRFIYLKFKHKNPEYSMRIVNQLSNSWIKKAEEIMGVDNLQILQYAKSPIDPITPVLRQNVIQTTVLFVLIGFVWVSCRVNNTKKISSEKAIVEEAGLVVLGTVTNMKEKKRHIRI
ncbi:MAG: hypothetical protein CVU84_14145 [Firmicutes bacterium HGW-Firmicutes-1]|jgi:capsular polysaccharide biosynthesis protein|nr:MAG: hypothetical protein CVU84_14145 [Firmicutes bacterium HGW-Firmicutes-1]